MISYWRRILELSIYFLLLNLVGFCRGGGPLDEDEGGVSSFAAISGWWPEVELPIDISHTELYTEVGRFAYFCEEWVNSMFHKILQQEHPSWWLLQGLDVHDVATTEEGHDPPSPATSQDYSLLD